MFDWLMCEYYFGDYDVCGQYDLEIQGEEVIGYWQFCVDCVCGNISCVIDGEDVENV